MALAGKQLTWAAILKNTACNARAGEKYLSASSKQVSNEEACKQSCEDVGACRSITFLNNGRCSHFSTGCKERKFTANAISIELNRKGTTTTPAATTSTSAATTALIGKGAKGTTTALPGRFINVLH